MLLYIYIYFLLYNFVLFLWYIVSITEQLYCESSYNYIYIYPFTPEPPSLLPTLDSFFPLPFHVSSMRTSLQQEWIPGQSWKARR